MGIELASIGKAWPPNVVSNEMAVDIMNRAREPEDKVLTAAWIEDTVLIKRRLRADDTQNNSDLALEAANEALAKEGISFEDTDIIVSPTSSPEMWFPSIPCLAMQKAGVERGPMAFDLLAACTGTVYAIDIVNAMLLAHEDWRYGLIMSSEIISRNLDYSDPNSGLFGDLATTMLWKKTDNLDRGFICSVSGTLPQGAHLAWSRGRSNRFGDDWAHPNFSFNGRQVHNFVVTIIEEAINKLVDKAGISVQDIELIVPHQANGKAFDRPAERLGIPPDKFFVNIARYANTSTCSIPMALYEAQEQGRAKPGDLVTLVGYGSGLTWGAVLLRI